MTKKQNTIYVVLAYAVFWVLLIAAVGIMSAMPEAAGVVLPVVQVVGTWAPTIALLILFKKLYPGSTVKGFFKNAFKERLSFKMLAVATVAYGLITVATVSIAAFDKNVSFFSLLSFSFGGLIITLFSGAMGEEAGWRTHLQQSMEKKHSLLKTCLIVGIIWAFWHAPTWMDAIAANMAWYIPLDILSKISNAFIIGICYNRCRNLFVPMWIHFVTNILSNGMQGFIVEYIVWYIILLVFVAACYIVWYLRSSKK